MDGFDIRTTPFSYHKDNTFFVGNKGRTAIDPNIFILVSDGIIGLFTGYRSAFDEQIDVQKVAFGRGMQQPLKRTLRIFVGVPFFVHNRFCIAASIWLFSKLSK